MNYSIIVQLTVMDNQVKDFSKYSNVIKGRK